LSREYEIAFQLMAEMDQSVKRSFTDINKHVEGLETQLKQIEKSKGPERAGKGAKKAGSLFEDAKRSASSFQDIVVRVAQYTGAYAFISGITGGFKDAIALVGEFESAMDQIQASTGASNAEMKGLEDTVNNLYKMNMGENWTDLSDSIAIVKQTTQQTGKELEETTKNAIMYRDVFKGDIQESIRTVDTMMKNFGITSEESYNLLAQGSQKGLDKNGELMDTMNEYSPLFAKMGFGADGMLDTLASGLEAGAWNLDKVGDGIKEFGIRTKDGSKGSMQAYKALGLSGEEMTDQFAAGGDVAQKAFLKTVKAINSVKDPAVKNTVAIQLFGTQAEDLEDKVIKAYGNVKKQFDMTKDTMDQVGKVKYDSLSLAIQGIGRTFEVDVFQPIAQRVLPELDKLTEWFGSSNGKEWMENVKDSINGVIDSAVEVYKYIKDHWEGITKIVVAIGVAVASFKVIMMGLKVMSTINALMTAYRAGTLLATVAQWNMNAAILANPIAWIVAAIAGAIAVIVLLALNWDKVLATMKGWWDWTMTNLGNIGTWFGEKFGQAGDAIHSAFDGMVGWFKGIGSGIRDTFNGVVNFIIDKINFLIEKMNGISFDIPELLGGGTVGFSIPTIPNVGAYATGGYTNGPELAWVGEGRSDEFMIPNNSSKKSQNLLRVANNSVVGRSVAGIGGGGGNITYAPNFIIQGNADEKVMKKVSKESEVSFSKQYAQHQRTQRRVSLG
jgi:phage-related minor tail protein